MKKKPKSAILLTAAALMLVAAPCKAPAAEKQVAPAIVISVASIDEQFLDVAFMAKAMQAPLEMQLGLGFAKAMIPQGIDTTKPMGGYVTIDADENIQQAFFVAVTDLDKALNALKQFIPDREDVGKGVIKVTAANGQSSFIKQQGGWVFISERAENLATLPKDPATLLGELPKKYNIAVQIKPANVPNELKQALIGAMKAGFEETRAQIKQRNPEAAPLVDEFGPAFLEGIEQIVNQTDDLLYAIGIDQQQKTAFLDIGITGKAGSQLAKDLTGFEIKSRFRGFALPNAAASLNLATKMSESDMQTLKDLVDGGREAALEKADGKLQKEVLGTVFEVIDKTVAEGKVDAGAVLLLGKEPGTHTLAIGAHVANGKALDKALREIVKQAPAGGPEIKIDAAKHGDVVFHSAKIGIPRGNNGGRQVLGESTEVTIGLSKNSLYFAVGNDTIATLKKVIDASKKNKDNSSTPLQVKVSAGSVLHFAAAIGGDADLQKLAQSLQQFQGKDNVSLTMASVKRGALIRLEAEEGAMFAIGQALQKVIQQQGPGGIPGFPPNALGNRQ